MKGKRDKIAIQKKDISIIYLLPLIVAVSIIPLIVYLNVIELQGIRYETWIGQQFNYDFYSYYKSIAIIFTSIFMLVLLFAGVILKEISIAINKIYYPIFAFFVLLIVSSLATDYREIAVYGYVDRYEGLLVWVAYLIFLLASMNLIRTLKSTKVIFVGLFFSASVVGLLGLGQFFGYDFFKSSLGLSIIIPKEFAALKEGVVFHFDKHTIYSTLYNSNYVGSYMAMLFPLSLAAFLLVKEKKHKLIAGAFSVLMFANLIGCRSRGGLLGAGLALIVLAFLLRREIANQFKGIGGLLVCFFLTFTILNSVAGGGLLGQVERLYQDAQHIVPGEELGRHNERVFVNQLQIDGSSLKIVANEVTLFVVLEGEEKNKLTFKDEKGNELALEYCEEIDMNLFTDTNYRDFAIGMNEEEGDHLLKISIDNKNIFLFITNNEIYFVSNRGYLLNELRAAPYIGFEGKERLGSGRGYIWSRTLPLIRDTIILGHGPDTFPIFFPQYDYIAKLNFLGNSVSVVDKPHNLYLQIAVGTGILSLLAILTLFAMYYWDGFKRLIRGNEDREYLIISSGVLAAVTGYLVAGMFNDSVVSVAPVFWVLLGLGISLNKMNLQK